MPGRNRSELIEKYKYVIGSVNTCYGMVQVIKIMYVVGDD